MYRTQSGQRCNRLVEFVDIYPTLCELAGIKTENETLHGRSFGPLLDSPEKSWKEAAFSKYGKANSVVTDRYNYMEFENGDKLLFDLTRDAAENENLAGKPEHQQVVGQLSQVLRSGLENAQ